MHALLLAVLGVVVAPPLQATPVVPGFDFMRAEDKTYCDRLRLPADKLNDCYITRDFIREAQLYWAAADAGKAPPPLRLMPLEVDMTYAKPDKDEKKDEKKLIIRTAIRQSLDSTYMV